MSAGTLVGHGMGAAVRGPPDGCWASSQRGGGFCSGKSQPPKPSAALLCHTVYSRSEALRLAHIHREETNSTFGWETCQRICGHVFNNQTTNHR